jgi:hypothetical protein
LSVASLKLNIKESALFKQISRYIAIVAAFTRVIKRKSTKPYMGVPTKYVAYTSINSKYAISLLDSKTDSMSHGTAIIGYLIIVIAAFFMQLRELKLHGLVS